jgi:hypothetical protein
MTGRSRGVILLVACFVAGIAVGVAGDRALRDNPGPVVRFTSSLPDALDKLDLTREQRQAADSLLAQRTPRTDAVMREAIPRLAAIADSLDAELRALLTPAQRTKLDSLKVGRLLLLKRGGKADTLYRR